MAARVRASFTDDDSISDHLTLEMVRIKVPQTTSTTTNNNDPDEQITLNESGGTAGSSIPATNDFLANLFTYKKVISTKLFYLIYKILFIDRIIT